MVPVALSMTTVPMLYQCSIRTIYDTLYSANQSIFALEVSK